MKCQNLLGLTNALTRHFVRSKPVPPLNCEQIAYNVYQSLMDQQPFRPEQESSATMPTATATFPLHEIAQRINHHERELADLRKEYELRQTQLTALARRKEELQAQLQQIDAEIVSIDQATVTKVVNALAKINVRLDPTSK